MRTPTAPIMRAPVWLAAAAIVLALACAPAAYGQVVYGVAGISDTTPVQGLADTELDYDAFLYYYPVADGYMWANNTEVAQGSSSGDQGSGSACLLGYVCAWVNLSAPGSPLPSTTYETQTNVWVTPYYTEVNSNITYFEDVFGFDFLSAGNYNGDGTIDPPSYCVTDFFNSGTICALTTASIYVGSVYIAFTTPEPNPIIGGIEVNGMVTNTIVAGTSGYIAIYGEYLDGATSVGAPPGITITRFQVYNNGGQINAFFQASPTAAAGQHNVTVTTTHGTSNGSPAVTVAINVKLQQTGSTTISTDGKYSENTTVQVTAVRADTGATITTFTGAVNIAEDGTSIYTQNGGTLPSSVSIASGGTVSFVAKSLAGPASSGASGAPPSAAKIKTTNYPVYGGTDLALPQWIISGARIDPKSSGQVYDWLQSRTKNIFSSATGVGATVLAAVSTYTIKAGNFTGQCPWVRGPQSPIILNPYYVQMRLDSPGSSVCGNADPADLTNTVYHEGRHAYQASQVALAGNDKDGDFLVNAIAIAPTTIVLDTTTSRTVCNESTAGGTTMMLAYHGDSVFDQPNAPDYASYAWEEDAWVFAAPY